MPNDVVLDDEGLWATVPVAGVDAVPRAVPTRAGMRAGQAWPLAPDARLPHALVATLEAPPDGPLDGIVALARLAAAALEAASGPLVPAPRPDGPGWRWQPAPGPDAATAWAQARRDAAEAIAPGRQGARTVVDDWADDLVAALAGPVTDLPDDLPPRLSFRRSAALRRWAARVAARRAADARLAFRLDAPPGDDADGGPWRLVPLAVRLSEDTTRRPLAASDPVDDFGTTSHAWHEWLVAEAAALRTAWPESTVAAWARLFSPDAEPSGERAARALNASVALDVEEVLGLLDHGAQALADAGFDVVAESGLLRRSRVRTRARSTSVESGLTAGGLALTVGVSVDGVDLTPEEIAVLASSKADLVVVRGRWTRVDDGERARLARLLDRLRSPVTAADLVADEAFEGVEAEPPQQLAVARRVEPPAGLLATLRHYQRDGLDWLTWVEENRTGGVLADDMGLGKTVQVIARVLADVTHGDAGPTLVVCPLTLVDTWARQVAQFAPTLRVAVHHGSAREDVATLAAGADLVLTTYGLLARDESLRAVEWHRVVLDEAQAVKNPDTRTARAARALRATHRLAVTGTPVENHLGELWSVMAFAAPGILPRRKEFERVFVRSGVGEEALSRLRVATAPFVLRRTKTDPGVAPDLPPRTVIREDCALTREQVGAYEAAAAAMLEEVGEGGAGRRLNVLAGISRLKQILVHPALLTERRTGLAGRSGKVDRLVELLAQIVDEGQAVVVFTQFASFVPALATHLRAALDVDVLTLTGADDRKVRADVVERFSADDGPPVLVVSLKAGGTGLTLVRANHVVHLDRWWNPAVEDQASDRVWRIGQKQKVFVHTLVCPGTLEDRIDAMLAGKRAVASSVVRSTDTRVTELTDAELSELVTLVRERVLT